MPGSWFATALVDALAEADGPEVPIFGFSWSGANTHAARTSAGNALGAALAALAGAGRFDRFVLIGHSHGGNVALHAALHSPAGRWRIAGVETLATPFLLFDREPSLVGRIVSGLDTSVVGALAWAAPALLRSLLLYLQRFGLEWSSRVGR